MKMQLQYKTTRLGKFAYHFRKGNPLVVFMSGFGDFDTAQNFLKLLVNCLIITVFLRRII